MIQMPFLILLILCALCTITVIAHFAILIGIHNRLDEIREFMELIWNTKEISKEIQNEEEKRV